MLYRLWISLWVLLPGTRTCGDSVGMRAAQVKGFPRSRAARLARSRHADLQALRSKPVAVSGGQSGARSALPLASAGFQRCLELSTQRRRCHWPSPSAPGFHPVGVTSLAAIPGATGSRRAEERGGLHLRVVVRRAGALPTRVGVKHAGSTKRPVLISAQMSDRGGTLRLMQALENICRR